MAVYDMINKKSEVTRMYCPNCDKSFPDHHRFCSDCGHRFDKKHQGTLWIPAAVLAVMFAIGLAIWYFV